jgi:hypothetical protein
MKLSDLYTEASRTRFDANSKRGECCDVCGRLLKSRTLYVVERYDTGELVPVGSSVEEGASCVYVGPECAKRLKGYVHS